MIVVIQGVSKKNETQTQQGVIQEKYHWKAK